MDLLPIFYPQVTHIICVELAGCAAFLLGNFKFELFCVNCAESGLNLPQKELPEVFPQLRNIPKHAEHILIKVTNPVLKTISLLKHHSDLVLGQLFAPFRTLFEPFQRYTTQKLQNGVLTYKQRLVEDFSDLRMQANHYIANYREASHVFMGTKHTRLQGAV